MRWVGRVVPSRPVGSRGDVEGRGGRRLPRWASPCEISSRLCRLVNSEDSGSIASSPLYRVLWLAVSLDRWLCPVFVYLYDVVDDNATGWMCDCIWVAIAVL